MQQSILVVGVDQQLAGDEIAHIGLRRQQVVPGELAQERPDGPPEAAAGAGAEIDLLEGMVVRIERKRGEELFEILEDDAVEADVLGDKVVTQQRAHEADAEAEEREGVDIERVEDPIEEELDVGGRGCFEDLKEELIKRQWREGGLGRMVVEGGNLVDAQIGVLLV